jgi:hypothetical protein
MPEAVTTSSVELTINAPTFSYRPFVYPTEFCLSETRRATPTHNSRWLKRDLSSLTFPDLSPLTFPPGARTTPAKTTFSPLPVTPPAPKENGCVCAIAR